MSKKNCKGCNIKQYLNKGVSTPVGIIIIFVLAIVVGGILTWQFWPEEVPAPSPTASPTSTTTPSLSPTPTAPLTPEPYINIISPNGGEYLIAGATYQIEWNTGISESIVNIILFNKDILGASASKYWQEEVPNTGTYKLTIGDSWSGDNFMLYISAGDYHDDSDACFNIVASDETADWKIYANDEYGFSFRYPEELSTEFISINSPSWPPKVEIGQIDSNFICEENSNLKTLFGYGKREKITINNNTYCLTTGSDGAAGKSYITYQYVTNRNNHQITFEFVLIYPSCGGFYGIDNIMERCEEEESMFDPNIIADQMFSTFKFID